MPPKRFTAKRFTYSIPNRKRPSESNTIGTARLLDLGRRSYAETWALQRALHAGVAAGHEDDVWIAVEHDPVVTIGRQGKTNSLLVPRETLLASGVELHEIERGGDVTYHGPGQVVVYPIMRLPRFREVVPLVRKLEEAAIAACARYGVTAERWSAHAGAWVGQNCICAIGLAVKKMTSLHGIALNASTALDYDRLINPCGLVDRGITSLSHETQRLISYDDAKNVLLDELSRVFDVTFVRSVIPNEVDLSAVIPAVIPSVVSAANVVEGQPATSQTRKAS